MSAPTTSAPALRIGPLELASPVVLAPMAGVTNVAFRTLCREIEREQQGLATVRSRPVLSQPDGMILVREEDLDRWRTRAWTATNSLTLRAQDSVAQMRARVRALSPQQTLDRGYAVVQTADGSVLTDASRAQVGQQLTVRLAAGELGVDVTGTSTRQPGATGIFCSATVETIGQTGVEMEALTAVQVALLTIYDMCKAVDRGMVIEGVRVEEKHGGKSGSFVAGAGAVGG